MTALSSVAPEPELVSVEPATTAVVRGAIPIAGIRDFFDASFRSLAETVVAQGVAIVSPAFAIYHDVSAETVDVEVGFVTDRAVQPQGDVAAGSLPGGRVARLMHLGSFD